MGGELSTLRWYGLIVNPTAMPYSTRRFLEWIHLVLAAYCFGVGFGDWLASPLRAENGWSAFIFATGIFSFPFVLVTSLLLLFVNERRAVLGFALAVLACVAFSQVGVVVR